MNKEGYKSPVVFAVAAGSRLPDAAFSGFLDFFARARLSRAEADPCRIPTRTGYDRWAEIYDGETNPLVVLEEPHVMRFPRAGARGCQFLTWGAARVGTAAAERGRGKRDGG